MDGQNSMIILMIGGRAQGKRAYAEQHFPGCRIVDAYQERVREALSAGRDPMREAEELLRALRKERLGCVVICEEVGCGVIPMERSERVYQEAVGRVCCSFAEAADRVIRVTAGLGMQLK